MSSMALPFEPEQAPPRLPASGTPARIGRCEAEISSATSGELRLRHVGPLKVGTEVMLTYFVGGVRIQSQAMVRTCRVLAVSGGAGGSTLYETCVTVR
jgi:hypothetical protein